MDELRGDRLWAGNRRTDYNGISAQLKGATQILWIANVPLDQKRHAQGAGQFLHHGPVHGALPFCLRRVAVQGGGDGIGASSLGGAGLGHSGYIREDRPSKLVVNARYEFWPWLSVCGASGCAIQSDDVSPRLSDGHGTGKVGGNFGTVATITLVNSENRKLRFRTKAADSLSPIGSKSASTATQCREGKSSQDLRMIQRIARRGLAGDDQLVPQPGRKGYGGMG